MSPFRQDLSKAAGGTITGRGGNVQQLGKAAMRRMPAAPAAPKPAWQQLAEKGIGGQGSAAANKAALAARAPDPTLRASDPMRNKVPTDMRAQPISRAFPGGPTDMGIAKRMPPRGGMASYLPGAGGVVTDFMDRGAAPPASVDFEGGMMTPDPSDPRFADFQAKMQERLAGQGGAPLPGMAPGDEMAGRAGQALEGGVDSNAFAANGGTPSGAPLQPNLADLAKAAGGPGVNGQPLAGPAPSQPGGGQAARIAALIARLRGGGGGMQMQAA